MKKPKKELHEYSCLLCGRIRTVKFKPIHDIVCEYCVVFLKEHPRPKLDGRKMTLEEYMATENGALLRGHIAYFEKVKNEKQEKAAPIGQTIP